LDFRIQLFILASLVAGAILLLAVLHSPRLLQHIQPVALEAMITIMMSMALCASVLSAPAFVNRMRGRHCIDDYIDPVYCTDCEAMTVLVVDIYIAVAHIGLPIRWHILLVLQAVAVVLYACVTLRFAFGEVRPTGLPQVIFLTGLVYIASLGKRSAELVERQTFVDLIDERTRRYQAEFKLSAAEETGRGGSSRGSQADDGSLPTTTATGKVFNAALGPGVDIRDGLSQIASIVDAEHWRIRASELRMLPGRPLGAGGFGVVCRAAFCGMAVAVKIPRGDHLRHGAAKRLLELCNELRVLRRLKHPNIVTVLGVLIDPDQAQFALVLELVRGEVLDKFMLAPPGLPTGSRPDTLARQQIMSGICLALLYMHMRTPPVVHGDLKPGNIMVEVVPPRGAIRPRLLDFGLSRVVAPSARPLGHTLQWMAPEVLRSRESLRCSADVYTAGLIFAFVATDAKPTAGMYSRSNRVRLARGTPLLPTWPQGCPFESMLRPCIERCLLAEPKVRPAMAEIHGVLVAVPAALGLEDSGDIFPLSQPHAKGSAGSPQTPPQQQVGVAQLGELPSSELSSMAEWGMKENTSDPHIMMPQQHAPLQPTEPLVHGGVLAMLSEEDVPPEDTPLEDVPVAAAPEVIFTTEASMMLGLVEAVSRWHVPLTDSCCCPFHRDVQAAQQIVSKLLRTPCRSTGIMIAMGRQCPHCGILGLDAAARECDFCGNLLAEEGSM